MIVVSDTTPLISLMKIEHLDLLEKYFQEVQIPEAVFRELTVNSRFANEAEQMQIKIMGTIGDCFWHLIKMEISPRMKYENVLKHCEIQEDILEKNFFRCCMNRFGMVM